MLQCMRACVCVCARAHVHVCVWVWMCVFFKSRSGNPLEPRRSFTLRKACCKIIFASWSTGAGIFAPVACTSFFKRCMNCIAFPAPLNLFLSLCFRRPGCTSLATVVVAVAMTMVSTRNTRLAYFDDIVRARATARTRTHTHAYTRVVLHLPVHRLSSCTLMGAPHVTSSPLFFLRKSCCFILLSFLNISEYRTLVLTQLPP